jgi:hypothetical protein
MASTTVPIAGKLAKFALLSPMSDSPGQILCTVASDSRLIAAGAAAVSSHAARRAGFSREAQDEIAGAAIEVCEKAFRSKGAPQTTHAPLRFEVSDLPDRIEVTLVAAETQVQAVHTPVETSLKRPLAEQVRCEAGDGYFRMTIARLIVGQNSKPACH